MEDRELFREANELRVYLRTVGDLVRLQILRLLAHASEMTVLELVAALRVSQPLISWHLSVLRRSDLVSLRREGRLVYYALNCPAIEAFQTRFDKWIDQNVREETDG
ncbi:MAG: winged helix-turn-helix transcriptional regulator [Anaerolineae bacterium]|nr:winged helix-turn-helix transcriptional regulator [Anaerolineae bacterium]